MVTRKTENQGTSKIFFTIVILYPSLLMGGESDLESLNVVTNEKKLFASLPTTGLALNLVCRQI